MKDINKILAKTHFKCIKKRKRKKKDIFAKTCLHDAVRSLLVMPSLLPHCLWGRSQVSLFFASVVSPDYSIRISRPHYSLIEYVKPCPLCPVSFTCLLKSQGCYWYVMATLSFDLHLFVEMSRWLLICQGHTYHYINHTCQ